MNALREYALSIIVTALSSSIILGLLQETQAKNLAKMVCGMVLTITVVAPLWKLDLSYPEKIGAMITDSAGSAAEQGEELSREAWETCIIQKTEAYILDKAAEFNARITVQVSLSEGSPPVPFGVVLSGDVSEYEKRQLEEVLQTQLGIAKERLEWTG